MLAFLLAAASAIAQGTIVYNRLNTPNPDPNFPWDFEGMRLNGLFPQSYNLDLNGDGNADYVILASGPLSTAGFYIYGVGGNGVWANQPFDSRWVVAMNAGETIGSSMTPVASWYSNPDGAIFCACVGGIGCLGYYAGLDSAYAGLRFQLNGETHYGWLRVGAPIPDLNGGWIYDYAYDTRPDAAIFAGAVPEPSSFALLGLGGIALWLFKRKK
jgi:hypothetical protein